MMIFLSKTYLVLILLFCMPGVYTEAQVILGLSTTWDDSFKEWVIYAEEEENDGTLTMRWPLRNDWTEWDFDFYGLRGELFMRRETDPEYWEGTAGNSRVTCRTVWPGDRRTWVVAQGDMKIEIGTVYGDIADEWLADDRRFGFLRVYTDWEGDPRDWIVEDGLSDEVPLLMKLMMIHIVLMQSVPRI